MLSPFVPATAKHQSSCSFATGMADNDGHGPKTRTGCAELRRTHALHASVFDEPVDGPCEACHRFIGPKCLLASPVVAAPICCVIAHPLSLTPNVPVSDCSRSPPQPRRYCSPPLLASSHDIRRTHRPKFGSKAQDNAKPESCLPVRCFSSVILRSEFAEGRTTAKAAARTSECVDGGGDGGMWSRRDGVPCARTNVGLSGI